MHPLGVQSDGIHTTLAARVANAAARLALTKFPFVGSVAFTDAVDVGKEARDEDTGRIFTLSGVGPAVWVEKLVGTAACFAANLASATVAGFMAAADYVRLHGTVSALAPTTVATGAGYVTVHTTAALLAVKNTSVPLRFSVSQNRALASHEIGQGDVALMVAWLDDDTQRIQSTKTGIDDSGATPALTGNTQTGIGWRATLNADHTVTLEIAQDAAVARSITSRVFVGPTTTQVDP